MRKLTWAPLVHLHALGDGISQSELAAAVGLDGSSLVRLLDLLVEQGLIERRPHASDRRVKLVQLTAAGRRTVTSIRKRLGSIESELLCGVHPDDAQAMLRALQRSVGTLIGAAIAWLILSNHPSFWLVLLAVVLFQFVTELVIGINYALGQICITPMALLMTSLAAPASTAGMPLDRVLDTVLGALIGMAFALIFSSLDDRAHLAAHHARAGARRSKGACASSSTDSFFRARRAG